MEIGSISFVNPQCLAPFRCSINGNQGSETLTPREVIKPGKEKRKCSQSVCASSKIWASGIKVPTFMNDRSLIKEKCHLDLLSPEVTVPY